MIVGPFSFVVTLVLGYITHEIPRINTYTYVAVWLCHVKTEYSIKTKIHPMKKSAETGTS